MQPQSEGGAPVPIQQGQVQVSMTTQDLIEMVIAAEKANEAAGDPIDITPED